MVNPAIGQDGTVYIGLDKFYAFDASGNIKWQYPAGNTKIFGLRSAPVIDDSGNIYFVSPEPTAYNSPNDSIRGFKFNPNGDLIWTTLLENQALDAEGPYQGRSSNGGGGHKENEILSSPSFSVGEKYLYIPVGNTINKVDTQSGKIAWSIKLEGATGSFKHNPAVDGRDTIYIGTKSNEESMLYAIDANGKMVWKNLIGGDMYPAPFLGDDGKLYVGSEEDKNNNILHAIDTKTGQETWTIAAGGRYPGFSFGSPTLYNGYVYSGCSEVKHDKGKIYSVALAKIKVGATNYAADSPWPRFHGDNGNTGRNHCNSNAPCDE